MNNDFTTKFDDSQLEDMRQQMATLKKKLAKQEIVNDRLIRSSIKKNVSNINRRYYVIMVLGILSIPYFYWVFVKLVGFSIAFWIASCIFMLICTAATYYNSKDIRDSRLMEYDLVEARTKVARAKKFDAQWLFIGIPMVILWLMWFVYECNQKSAIPSVNAMFYGGVIGGILGAVIGFKIHFKTQRQYQEIIDQIENLTQE